MAVAPPPLNRPRGWTDLQVNSHLHSLKILFYIYGGLQLVLAVLLLLAAAGGYVSESHSPNPEASPALLAAFFVGASLVFAALGSLSLTAARRLSQRRQRTLCMVAAGAACLGGALGIALGVYALVVLLRAEVVASFSEPGSAVVA